jgi:hypothetical protein
MLIRVSWGLAGYGVKSRVLVRAAVVIAAAAAVMLGVVAVTAGLAAASGLAGVIVGFCELAAAALAVIGWAGERRSAASAGKEGRSTSGPSAGQPAGQGPTSGHSGGKYAVTMRDNAQGIMIGDGNVQNIDLRHSHRDRVNPGSGESA